MNANQRRSWSRRIAGTGAAMCASMGLFGAQGCLDRPVVNISPGGSSVNLQRIRVAKIDKIDLLIMVDNSISMADKQSELGKRIPALIKALTNPENAPTGGTKTQGVLDLHVGVITSSLGSFGTGACSVASSPTNDDHGMLLPRKDFSEKTGYKVDKVEQERPDAVPCPGGLVQSSALTWVIDKKRDPKATYEGIPATTTLQTAASCLVGSAHENGCGYEAQLESVYHFLIDPAPYDKAEAKCALGSSGDDCGNNLIELTPMGKAKDPEEQWGKKILEQRKAFLRRDSLLAVLLLTDENDASLMPDRKNWIPWAFAPGTMQHGFKGCKTVPEDFEPATSADYDTLFTKFNCWSCFLQDKGHPDLDGSCKVGWDTKDKVNKDPDGRNTREFQQTRRFGYNFYWSRDRYVRGFTEPSVVASDGKLGVNPIYEGGFRSKDLVVVAGILGVPKDLVQDAAGKSKELTGDDWDKIVGPDYDSPKAAERAKVRDPHMVESIAPRTDLGIKHFAGDRNIDLINGGDRDIIEGDDLQYACIAPRTTAEDGQDCEKNADKNPLCDGLKKQPYFKAYPGLRELRVIRDITQKGAVGVVSSICNNTYLPAVQSIVDKLQAALNAQCIATVLTADEATKNVNCLILEVFDGDTVQLPDGSPATTCRALGEGYCTPGAAPCRQEGTDYPPVGPQIAAEQLRQLDIGITDTTGAPAREKMDAKVDDKGNVYVQGVNDRDKKKHLICEMKQLAGRGVKPEVTKACTTDPKFTLEVGKDGGWCYSTDDKIVSEDCKRKGNPGTIRFLGNVSPKNRSDVFTYCITK